MAADATTAMTIDFLRARLLSERSVSRAAKERADQLAWRVTELEEQLRTVTTQRRKAERAAAEVLAILESQGFARLSDAPDSASSSSDDDTDGPEATASSGGGKEVEDALSGSTPGGTAAAAAADGALSWKGRAAGHDSERRQQHKGRQPRPRHSHSHSHSHSHRRGYFYLLTADSSPKYQPGQSCRKIKRKELRFHTEGEEAKDNNVVESPEEVQERTDCTVCTDEQPDLDGEVSQDGRGSCGGGMVEEDSIASDQYAIEYGKDGEMERVLEQQAELIGQYEAEENAQREWEKKFSTSRDSAVGDVELGDKVNQIEKACEQRDKAAQIVGKEVVCQEERSSDEHLPGINSPSECLSKDSASELPPNEPKESAIEQHKVVESDNDFGQATATVSSVDSETRVSKDELVNRSCNDIIEGIRNNLGRSEPSLQGSYDSNPNARHDEGQGNESSDGGSNYHVNARSYEHYINTPSDTSPLSEWSSSCFHNHTDNQIETQLYQPTSDDVGGVLEALQRAKMSLREKLQRPIPPSLTMLALPAPEDPYTKDDLPVRDTQLSLSRSRPPSQEILALPEPADYLSRILPQDDVKVPVGLAGLFRLPTDPFPQNVVCSPDGYGLRLSLTATSRHTIFSSNRANHAMSTPSLSQYDTGFSSDSYRSRRSSMLLPNFTADDTSFLPEVPRSKENLRRGVHSGDAGMLFHYSGDYSF